MTEKKEEVKGKRKAKRAQSAGKNVVATNRPELLVTVVGRDKAAYYVDLIQSFDVNLQVISLAYGTADEKMLGYLGLTDNEKAVIFSVIQEEKIPDALATLSDKFNTIKNGKGIAYTVPLTSVIGSLIYGFLCNNRKVVKEDAGNKE